MTANGHGCRMTVSPWWAVGVPHQRLRLHARPGLLAVEQPLHLAQHDTVISTVNDSNDSKITI